MSLSPEEIIKISHLARLAIEEQAIPKYTQELSNIFNLVEQMNQVDTTGIEPTTHPLDLNQRLRADAITEPNQREQLQKGAPKVEAGLYLVPQVIE
jgi:aspartyl-tRNA(Asn)/glutamyl-tRNA(Gln) amidotransferase subunit C